eukprot:170628-Amphidinium_carterae.1
MVPPMSPKHSNSAPNKASHGVARNPKGFSFKSGASIVTCLKHRFRGREASRFFLLQLSTIVYACLHNAMISCVFECIVYSNSRVQHMCLNVMLRDHEADPEAKIRLMLLNSQ